MDLRYPRRFLPLRWLRRNRLSTGDWRLGNRAEADPVDGRGAEAAVGFPTTAISYTAPLHPVTSFSDPGHRALGITALLVALLLIGFGTVVFKAIVLAP